MLNIPFEQIREKLAQNHYAHVPFPASPAQIDAAVATFLQFLNVPLEQKQKIITLAVPGDDAFTCGYELKLRRLGHKDNKEMFHDNRQLRRNLESLISDADPRVRDFLDASWPIYSAVEEQARMIVPQFEQYAPGITSRFFPNDKDPLIFLRYLAYLDVPDEDAATKKVLARDHYDHAPLTTSIKESKPGLSIGTPGNLKPAERKIGHSRFFLGPNLYNLLPEKHHNKFPLGYHGVRDIKNDNATHITPPGIARWAVVGFIWAEGLGFLPYDVCHPEAKAQGYAEGPRSRLPVQEKKYA